MINTILIDDEPLSRSLIKEYLAAHPGISVKQECQDGFEGLRRIMHKNRKRIFIMGNAQDKWVRKA